jgi:hypothetical protein
MGRVRLWGECLRSRAEPDQRADDRARITRRSLNPKPTTNQEIMMTNRILSALALSALVGVAACEREQETRIDVPATEAPATAPAPGTMDPAYTDPTLTDPAYTDPTMTDPMMHGDTLPQDTL